MSETPAELSANPLAPQLMLVASRALSAARPALIALLITSGAKFAGNVAHPISFCNVLFVGNACAAVLVGVWYGFGHLIADFRALDFKVKLGLLINGCLATLLSTLIFLGLQSTTVTNAVLLGRLGPVLFALAGAMVLGKRIRPLEWAGFSLIGVGAIAIALKTSNFQISRGDTLILLSTLVFAVSALINQLMIANKAGLYVVVFSRNFLSSIVFFCIALRLFGPHHFSDAFSGQLWIFMSIYALVVIVFAQLLWYASFEKLDSRTIGRLTVLSPVFGVFYAFVINGEQPSTLQLGTLAVVSIGVLIAGMGKKQTATTKIEKMAEEADNVASSS